MTLRILLRTVAGSIPGVLSAEPSRTGVVGGRGVPLAKGDGVPAGVMAEPGNAPPFEPTARAEDDPSGVAVAPRLTPSEAAFGVRGRKSEYRNAANAVQRT